jgi:hypothetical protein
MAPGVVPMPGRSTFYALIDRLAVCRHAFGSAATHRQTANRPKVNSLRVNLRRGFLSLGSGRLPC